MADRVVAAEAPAALLERQREIDAIEGALGAPTGSVLVLQGESGIGKSRLLDEARRLSTARGIEVLSGRGNELEREYSFGVVLRAMERRFTGAPRRERELLLRGRASLASPLLAPDVESSGSTDEFSLVHGLYWAVVNLSELIPVAMLIDDLHWVDDLSLRFLAYLADRLEDLPVVLVMAVRSGDPGAESDLVRHLTGHPAARVLRPAELSRDGVRTLLERVRGDVDDATLRSIWRACGGNPFLVGELALAARPGPESFPPSTVATSVTRRLRALGHDAVRLARACAVLGDGAPLHIARELALLDAPAAFTALDRLVAARILEAGSDLSFVHPVVRAAVRAGIPPGEECDAHTRAAGLLAASGDAADRVAEHLVVGSPTGEPWVMAALRDGARAAMRKGAPAAAKRYLRLAYERATPERRDGSLLIELGVAETACGEPAACERLEQALSVMTDADERAYAVHTLGRVLYRNGRHEEAARTYRRGAELFAADPARALEFEVGYMCAAQYLLPIHSTAMTRLKRSVPEVDRPPRGPNDAALQAALAVHLMLTTPPVARGLRLARTAFATGSLDSISANLTLFTMVGADALDEAEIEIERALREAQRSSDASGYAEASLIRAVLLHRRGQVNAAAADAEAAVQGRDHGWNAMDPLPPAILALCLLDVRDLERADTVLRESASALPGAQLSGTNAWFFWARGRLRMHQGDTRAALADFLAAGETLAQYDVTNPCVPWRSLAGLAAHAEGQDDVAAHHIDEEIRLAREYGLPARLGSALRAQAALERDDRAIELLRESLDLLEHGPAELEFAQTLQHLGRALRVSGRRAASRAPLRRGLDIVHRLGATRLVREIQDELRVSGARPRRNALSGVEALTPSETRIVRLAAEGQTKRQIAESLFLSQNTVAWHLRHGYQKLGVASREELRDVLARSAESTEHRRNA
jgi:DNA-binding CsgD family transcriptional regulator/tetratricopeptide (TPR) repeat protein